jgi:hypothetical protein
MKITDLTEEFFTQEQYIQEVTNLFVAIGENYTILSESTITEAGVWDVIKRSAGGIWKTVGTANDAINKLGQMAQNTKPVQAFDKKADEIIANIQGKLPDKTVEIIKKYRTWGINNPRKQTLIIAMLGAVSALAFGPAGGAGIAGVLRFGNELLKGEKASTAIGRSAKSAALGFGAGQLFSGLGELFGAFDPQTVPGIQNISYIRNIININGRLLSLEVHFPSELAPRIQALWNSAATSFRDGDIEKAIQTTTRIRAALADYQSPEFLNSVYQNNASLRQAALKAAETTKQSFDVIGSLLQGALSSQGAGKPPSTAASASTTPAPSTAASTQSAASSGRPAPAELKQILAIRKQYPQLSMQQATSLYNKRKR